MNYISQRNLSFLLLTLFLAVSVCDSEARQYEFSSATFDTDPLVKVSAEFDADETVQQPAGRLSLWGALTGGTVHIRNRIRGEFVNQQGTDIARAVTNRFQLGYRTLSLSGFSGYVDFVDVRPVGRDRYNAAGLNDQPNRAIIADPRLTLLNQMYGQFSTDTGDLLLRAGRQRIIHSNARFVGNVGWRQNEQTFDAVTVNSSLGLENLKAEYNYVWQVNRIFGPDHPAGIFESDSHLAHLTYENPFPGSRITAFAYHLDFDNAPEASSQTFGVRLNGSFSVSEIFSVNYSGSYARQNSIDRTPVDYSADYYLANVNAGIIGGVRAGISYEVLGSDDSEAAFQTPLATLHAYQGWADLFLTTPSAGLEDLSIFASVPLTGGSTATVRYHWYTFRESGERAGGELNASLGKRVNEYVSILIKYADFQSESFLPDTRKLWLQAEISF